MKTNVLIIGAGPTGLMAACQLKRFGIDCLILDKKEGPTHESRALVVHARSLEIYEQMGIATAAVQEGEPVKKLQFIVHDKAVQQVPLGDIGQGLSQFPYLLILEQSKNEHLLYDYLKNKDGDVLWQTELLSIMQDEKHCYADVSRNGEMLRIEADWVLAADGGRSPVRHELHVAFAGDTYEHIFYVADTKVQWAWGHDALSVYLAKKTFMALFPMRGEDRFRIVGVLPVAYQDEHPEHFEQIAPLIQQQAEIPLQFSDTAWFSVYRVHHRCIENFRSGRVFFAGDAAHVHSPVGGQGMNTGLQDAYNIAWKLAYVIKEFMSEKILDTYNQERLPFAKQLVHTTDRAFSIVTSDKWYDHFLRLSVLPFAVRQLFRFVWIKKNVFKTVSQIAIKYDPSNLVQNNDAANSALKAGMRFPYLKTNDDKSVYERMQGTQFYVLLFCFTDKTILKTITELQSRFTFLQVLDFSGEQKITAALKIKKPTIVVVRPDHYVGLITDKGAAAVNAFFQNLRH
jgi:2-polyprenyl-6-methoxyphenol hydroxylase-like FAD-dependent oxidoreductase